MFSILINTHIVKAVEPMRETHTSGDWTLEYGMVNGSSHDYYDGIIKAYELIDLTNTTKITVTFKVEDYFKDSVGGACIMDGNNYIQIRSGNTVLAKSAVNTSTAFNSNMTFTLDVPTSAQKSVYLDCCTQIGLYRAIVRIAPNPTVSKTTHSHSYTLTTTDSSTLDIINIIFNVQWYSLHIHLII